MRRIREVLRLKHDLSRNHREISASTGLSKGSVSEYLRRAKQAGLDWESARELSEGELEARLFKAPGRNLPVDRVPIDHEWVHREMRKKSVTLQLLWVEYREAAQHDPQGRRPYQYSQFCERHANFRERVDASMRQEHRGGERVFLDYSGHRPSIVDRETGEVIPVELYVAVLGASNYTYAEATLTQRRDEFIGSTSRAFEYFDGVPAITVPDQLRSAVSGPDRIDPELNPVFAEFAEHYGTAVIPARARKPKDKAKVEVGVQIAQRWILAQLRNITFFSLDDLNAAIAELLEQLNDKPFQKLEGCRRSAYEELDRPALKPLPVRRFEPSTWKQAKVHIDYHVEFEARFYSAPHHLIGTKLWIRATVTTIELVLDGRRVASHRRSYGRKGAYVTDEAHRPKSHRQYGAWPPQRIIDWASELGVNTGKLVARIIADRPHPEQGYRSCLALIRDVKIYSAERVEAACMRALQINAPTRRSVLAILRNGLDQVAVEDDDAPLPAPIVHDNVRGGDYYATGPHVGAADDEHDEDQLQLPLQPQPQPQPPNGTDNARRTDPPKDDGHEADGDGRGLPPTPERRTGQPAELRREDRPDDRRGVDGPGEPATRTTPTGGEADPGRGDGGRVDHPRPRDLEGRGA
jgi:transposase